MRHLLTIYLIGYSLFATSQNLDVSVNKNPALSSEIITLVFSLNDKGSDFIPPDISDFHIISGPSSGFQQSYSNINGQSTREIKTTITYRIQAKKEGKLKIGSASITANNKKIVSDQLIIEILEDEKEQESKNNNDIFIKTIINKKELFVGEQLYCIQNIYIKENIQIINTNISNITYNGFWEDKVTINKGEKREIINGIAYTVKTIQHSILTAQKSGELEIPSAEIEVSYLQQGELLGYDFFGYPQYKTKTISKTLSLKPKIIKVKKLPTPIPKYFYGTVSNNFSIKSEIDNDTIYVNDALTLSFTFRSRTASNIKMLQPFEIKNLKYFEVYDPIINDNTIVGPKYNHGFKIFKYILIAKKNGSLKIPSVKFRFFNPSSRKYELISTQEHTVQVLENSENTNQSTINSNLEKDSQSTYNLTVDKIDELNLNKKEHNKKKKNNYLIILILIILLTLLFLIYQNFSNRNLDLDKQRKIKANILASKRLKSAKICIQNNNQEKFYEEIEKCLWGYLSSKFNVKQSDLGKETIERLFLINKIPEDIKHKFVTLLKTCEFARYSSIKDENEEMQITLDKAKEIIISMESKTKSN